MRQSKLNRFGIRLCGFSFLVWVCVSQAAHAGLTVTPSRQEITILAGGDAYGEYVVRNDFNRPVKIIAKFRDWFVLLQNKEKGIRSEDWLSISPREFYLEPKEEQTVRYKVKLSMEAQGVLIAMLSFIPQEESSQLSMVLSVSLYVTVAGTEKKDWEIAGLKLDYSNRKFSASASIKNKGNVHLRPKGFVTLFSRKKKMFEGQFLEGRPVYPGLSRTLVFRREGLDLAPGKYSALFRFYGQSMEKERTISFKIKRSGRLIIK